MKQNLLLRSRYIIVATVWLLNFSCQSKNEEDAKAPDTSGEVTPPDIPEEPVIPAEPELLENTTWKLIGFVDAETGTLRKVEPEDCKSCYTITFDTDTTYSGKGYTNQIEGDHKIDYVASQIKILWGGKTKVVPYFDEELFFETLDKLQSFSLEGDELKLYYNDKKKYLLFKLKTS